MRPKNFDRLLQPVAAFETVRVRVCSYYPREGEGMFSPALVCVCGCVSVCDHDNEKDCGRICTKFYARVPRGKGKTKFVFRCDR